jgi:hypothetical protein
MLINSPNISGSLTVTGNATITGSLTVAGGISAAITGSATTASYVEYNNIANKPTLVSGSEQISFDGITDKPTLVSGSSQVTYSGLSGIPSGIVSSSTQITGYNIFATTGSNQFNGSQAITGSLTVTGQVVAQTLNVQQVTSSIVYSSGSNIFGNSLGNTQQFTGSLQVSGSSHYMLGNVGMGTTTPSALLHVTDGYVLIGIDKGVRFDSSGATGHPELSVDSGAALNFKNTSGGTNLTIANSGASTFASSATAGAFLTNAASGTAGQEAIRINNDNGYIGFFNGANNTRSGYIQGNTTDVTIATSPSTPLILATANAEKMRITSGGNVGINTASPNIIGFSGPMLTIAGTGQGQGIEIWRNSNSIPNDEDLGLITFLGGTSPRQLARIVGKAVGTNEDAGSLSFQTCPTGGGVTDRMRITSDGYVRLTSSSGGIQFNGDTAAANALDDYEEGTWTPVPTSTGATFSTSVNGTYTKIGRLVYITCQLDNSSAATGTLTNEMSITGLPFTSSPGSGFGASLAIGFEVHIDYPAGGLGIQARIPASSTSISLRFTKDDASGDDFLASNFDFLDARIALSGCYEV